MPSDWRCVWCGRPSAIRRRGPMIAALVTVDHSECVDKLAAKAIKRTTERDEARDIALAAEFWGTSKTLAEAWGHEFPGSHSRATAHKCRLLDELKS